MKRRHGPGLQQVRRKTTHVERPGHAEYIAAVGVVGHGQHGGSAVIDADTELFLSVLVQFQQMPLPVVHPATPSPCTVSTATVIDVDPQSAAMQLH